MGDIQSVYRCVLTCGNEVVGEARMKAFPAGGQVIRCGDFQFKVQSASVMENGSARDLDVVVSIWDDEVMTWGTLLSRQV